MFQEIYCIHFLCFYIHQYNFFFTLEYLICFYFCQKTDVVEEEDKHGTKSDPRHRRNIIGIFFSSFVHVVFEPQLR